MAYLTLPAKRPPAKRLCLQEMAADGRGRPATPRAADEQEPHPQRSTVSSRGRSPSTPKGKAPRAVSQKLVHSPALQRRSRIAHLRDSRRTSSKPPDATTVSKVARTPEMTRHHRK
ncbi:hypothetical protein DIPPA_06846 [Diplonema papillatum]|nr:hypothetical protein DIPPA_06846 [Diplonema papillatum]